VVFLTYPLNLVLSSQFNLVKYIYLIPVPDSCSRLFPIVCILALNVFHKLLGLILKCLVMVPGAQWVQRR
jgi:hypothetical protein